MKRIIMVAVALFASHAVVAAQEFRVGAIKIEQPWIRATPKGATVAGAYMTITNTGTTPDRLIGATATISGAVEVHEMALDGGVMKMRKLGGGVELKPGATVEFKPGAYHVMFTGLTRPVAMGEPIKARLTFEKAGTVEIEYKVQPVGSPGPAGAAPMPAH